MARRRGGGETGSDAGADEPERFAASRATARPLVCAERNAHADLARSAVPVMLSSGDVVVVMGGPSRLRYHGVTRILAGTAPHGTGPGRFNLTFRQW